MATVGRKPEGQGALKTNVVKTSNASIKDIMNAIRSMHKVSIPQTKEFAKDFDFTRERGFRDLWSRVKQYTYKADSMEHQIVKSARALDQIGVGDCKSFSIVGATTMINGGVEEVYYDLVHYGKENQAHIYPVGYLDGEEVVVDSVHDFFNERAYGEAYYERYDARTLKKVASGTIRGVDRLDKFIKVGSIAGGAYLMTRKSNVQKAVGFVMILFGIFK